MAGLKFMGQNKITKNAKPVSTITDNDGNDVLRVVDSAPHAYDEDADELKVRFGDETSKKLDAIIQLVGDKVMESSITRKMLYKSNLLWLYPLIDVYGTSLKNYSRIEYSNAENIGGKLQIAPNESLNKVLDLGLGTGGYDQPFVKLPKTAGVKGLSAFTIMGFFENRNNAQEIHFYNDYIGIGGDGNSKVRFSLRRTADKKLTAIIRLGDADSQSHTFINDSHLSTGFHHFAVTVDIVNKQVIFYMDGATVQQSITAGDWTETAFTNDESYIEPVLNAMHVADSSSYMATPGFRLAYVGMYSRALTATEILDISSAGGYQR